MCLKEAHTSAHRPDAGDHVHPSSLDIHSSLGMVTPSPWEGVLALHRIRQSYLITCTTLSPQQSNDYARDRQPGTSAQHY